MSEFGRGVVVPLVKFTEHVGDHHAGRIEKAIRWMKASPTEREKLMQEDDPEWILVLTLDEYAQSSEKMLDDLLTVWAYGASDHFVELDREHAPKSLRQLADLVWQLRYADVSGQFRGEEEWLKILAFWSAAAMDLDERLGNDADWGDW